MKLEIAAIASLAAVATALDIPAGVPQQFTFPKCGTNTIVSGIAQSGCSFTDASCLCKTKSFYKAATEGIPKHCPKAEEQAVFVNFINTVCMGQPSFPIVVHAKSSATSNRVDIGQTVWSALAAAALAAVGML